ncbi:hypothetical protein [Acinetobacter guillouiae]|nr:hypothetical protein [Acinetobacter guillouiae]MBP2544947.1 hypothetical protein [Acinetobacter guillouiae]
MSDAKPTVKKLNPLKQFLVELFSARAGVYINQANKQDLPSRTLAKATKS